jgi:hypothetical protein
MDELQLEIGGAVLGASSSLVISNSRLVPCLVCRTMKIPDADANIFRCDSGQSPEAWVCDACADLRCPHLMLDLRARRRPLLLSLARDIERLIHAPWHGAADSA